MIILKKGNFGLNIISRDNISLNLADSLTSIVSHEFWSFVKTEHFQKMPIFTWKITEIWYQSKSDYMDRAFDYWEGLLSYF